MYLPSDNKHRDNQWLRDTSIILNWKNGPILYESSIHPLASKENNTLALRTWIEIRQWEIRFEGWNIRQTNEYAFVGIYSI